MTLSRVRCPDCGAERGVRVAGSGLVWEEGHVCAKRPLAISKGAQATSSGDEGSPERAPQAAWSNAKPTQVRWPDGKLVTLPSKTEARVAERLIAETQARGERLYRQVRLPLLSIAPREGGTPFYVTVDFAIVGSGGTRYIDAKTARKSPEWARGKAAAAASGYQIEECER